MARFEYAARDESGKAYSGEIVAPSRSEAARLLRGEGKFVVKLIEIASGAGGTRTPARRGGRPGYARGMAAAAGGAGLACSPGRFLFIGRVAEKPDEIPQAIQLVEEIRPFGVILFARNVPDLSATLAWTENLRSRMPDLVLSVDHEGGRVHRLPEPFTRFPPALVMARHGDPGLVREAARAQARERRAAGFGWSYAPVRRSEERGVGNECRAMWWLYP